MAVILFSSCITSFQTAEVLPMGESVVGMGYSFPTQGELYFRRGIVNQVEIGVKAGVIPYPVAAGSDVTRWLSGEVKIELAPPPNSRALLIGGGRILLADRWGIGVYPTLLMRSRNGYVGWRFIVAPELFEKSTTSVGLGVVFGFAARPFKGRLTLVPEVGGLVVTTTPGYGPIPMFAGSLGLQWELKQ